MTEWVLLVVLLTGIPHATRAFLAYLQPEPAPLSVRWPWPTWVAFLMAFIAAMGWLGE